MIAASVRCFTYTSVRIGCSFCAHSVPCLCLRVARPILRERPPYGRLPASRVGPVHTGSHQALLLVANSPARGTADLLSGARGPLQASQRAAQPSRRQRCNAFKNSLQPASSGSCKRSSGGEGIGDDSHVNLQHHKRVVARPRRVQPGRVAIPGAFGSHPPCLIRVRLEAHS